MNQDSPVQITIKRNPDWKIKEPKRVVRNLGTVKHEDIQGHVLCSNGLMKGTSRYPGRPANRL